MQIREGKWRVAPLPECFLDRRVEITGPTDRKMVINALNRWVGAVGQPRTPPAHATLPRAADCTGCLLRIRLPRGAGRQLPPSSWQLAVNWREAPLHISTLSPPACHV
jgi:hypothetical protein